MEIKLILYSVDQYAEILLIAQARPSAPFKLPHHHWDFSSRP